MSAIVATSLLAVDGTASQGEAAVNVDDTASKLAEIERSLRELEQEMPDLQHRHRDVFSYANAWAERHDGLLRRTPPDLRGLVEQRLHRIGVRWGVVSGVRMTAQFPAIKLPV